jgi:hypothetical protein
MYSTDPRSWILYLGMKMLMLRAILICKDVSIFYTKSQKLHGCVKRMSRDPTVTS